jgi:hypothetical protein
LNIGSRSIRTLRVPGGVVETMPAVTVASVIPPGPFTCTDLGVQIADPGVQVPDPGVQVRPIQVFKSRRSARSRGRDTRSRRMGMAALDALSQRIVVRANVRGLQRHEMAPYLAHRLRLAGCELPLFETPAVEAHLPSCKRPARKANAL